MTIFHHTDYRSHDPDTNPHFHCYLCKKLEEGTRITVCFNSKRGYQRAPVSGVLAYRVWVNNDKMPFLVHDDGTWEAIIPQDQVELIEDEPNQSEDSRGDQGEAVPLV